MGIMSAPRKIIMIRHGQSAANADTSIYNRVPDYRIPLTALGLEQATAAGEDNDSGAPRVSVSLRVRTRQAVYLAEAQTLASAIRLLPRSGP